MRFSIVMPTYNRAKFLRHSLPSALEQTLDDYEVIVSDNCSTDDTAEIIRSHACDRLRSVRPSERLSMVDHWEFALEHAEGEWILILCDDDALLPECLATLDSLSRQHPACRLIQYDRFRYVYDDGIRKDGNYIEIGSHVNSGLMKLSSRRRLRTVFWRQSIELPKLLNSAARRSLIDDVRGRFGRVFAPWAPDISVGVRMLSQTPYYLKTGPLMLWGETIESYGSGAGVDPVRMLQFYEQFSEFEGRLPFSPYPELLTVGNGIYDTLRRLQDELGDEWRHLTIDPIRFRTQLLRNIHDYVVRGNAQFAEFEPRIRRDLGLLRRDPRSTWQNMRARASDFPEKLQRLKYGSRSKGRKEKHRFEDIHAAARFVGERVK